MLPQAEERRCCPLFHQAVELVGKRWTGAILYVLLDAGRPLRFSEIAHAVPDLSDRLLSERMKELEQRGRAPMHLHEEAREAGWSDEQLLEAIAVVALESFTALVNVAGDVPVDGSVEETRVLRAA